MITPVVRVYGVADQFDLEFTYTDNNRWVVSIPTDTSDGIYACEIYAEDAAGGMDVWTGVLYVHNGSAHLKFVGKGKAVQFFADGLKTKFKSGSLLKYCGGEC